MELTQSKCFTCGYIDNSEIMQNYANLKLYTGCVVQQQHCPQLTEQRKVWVWNIFTLFRQNSNWPWCCSSLLSHTLLYSILLQSLCFHLTCAQPLWGSFSLSSALAVCIWGWPPGEAPPFSSSKRNQLSPASSLLFSSKGAAYDVGWFQYLLEYSFKPPHESFSPCLEL